MKELLTERDKQIIAECLHALVEGSFIDDWEFPTVCNFDRYEMAQIIAKWPDDENSEDMRDAINDAMNNLIGYPHGQEKELAKRVSGSLEEIEEVYAKWRRVRLNV